LSCQSSPIVVQFESRVVFIYTGTLLMNPQNC